MWCMTQQAIEAAVHMKSGTDTARALNFVYDQQMFGLAAGGRLNATRILIIMTDGRSNSMTESKSVLSLSIVCIKSVNSLSLSCHLFRISLSFV
jgi:hypothetical protein